MKEVIKQQKTTIPELWHNSRIRITDVFNYPPVILSVDDSIIGTLGNFSASTGKAKSKKTFNVCAIVAASLTNGTVLNYSATLPSNKRNILYVDTEQSPFHCKRVLSRMLRLAVYSENKQPETLEFLSLRRFTPKVRLSIIEEAVYHMNGLGLVIIDGHREALESVFSIGDSLSYGTLIERLRSSYSAVGCECGIGKTKKLKQFLANKRMIIQCDDKRYRYNPDFHY